MIIKSHIRGGYRAAADYLKEYGKNEKIRTVEISDPDAKNLDEAFHNMWTVASTTRAKKPLHHISINPMKDERLTDEQVLKIVKRCEEKYGYKPNDHQRVIVEHIKDGRQHFHVIWNRVNLTTGKVIWPGQHWLKSKQAAREMERELGLKRPIPKRVKRMWAAIARSGRSSKYFGRYQTMNLNVVRGSALLPQPEARPQITPINRTNKKRDVNIPDSEKVPFRRPEWEYNELLIWAWENGRADILAQFGIFVNFDL